ncbi:MAG: type II secretion system protein [Planctomycetes bacterium]|nr:type II secretion system protein [Planctomycetota bacterium]
MKRRQAFTLIELLVVVAIISLLVSILLPSLQKAKELANTTICKTNMKNIGAALSFYIDDYNGNIPDADAESWGGNDVWKYVVQRHTEVDEGVFWCPLRQLPANENTWYGSYLINSYSWNKGAAENNISLFTSPSTKVAFLEAELNSNFVLYTQNGLIGMHPSHNAGYVHDLRSNVLWLDFHVGEITQEEVEAVADGRLYFDYRY